MTAPQGVNWGGLGAQQRTCYDAAFCRGASMGANRVFFPQQTLDEWLEQGHIALVGDELTIGAAGRNLRLHGAVHFVAEVAGSEDGNALVGKVKTHEQVAELGGEHVADSVILGDNAYQVVEGFIGELLPKAPGADKKAKRSTRGTPIQTGSPFANLLKLL